jgi:integrase
MGSEEGQFTNDNSSLSTPIPLSSSSDLQISEGNVGTSTNVVNSNLIADYPASAVGTYLQSSLAESTKKAYLSDVIAFASWGGQIPSSAAVIADYLVEHAPKLSPVTLRRRIMAFSKAHVAMGYADPTRQELVRGVLRGICRVHGMPQRQASPLRRADLMLLVDAIPDTLIGARDRALMLIGFAGGFRRSELVGLRVDDINFVPEGILVLLKRSKTDQIGSGRKVGIPFGRTRACPVKALSAWLERASIQEGPIFRAISKGGHVYDQALSAQAVNLLLTKCAGRAGLICEGLSAHSLRSGLVTAAAKAGVSSWKIRQQTGHKSDAMLHRYIRDADIFTENAAGALL